MIRGIGILTCTHIFGRSNNKSEIYIFGKKLTKKIEYIRFLTGGLKK